MLKNRQIELLAHVPDFSSWEKAFLWIKEGQQLKLEPVSEGKVASLAWNDVEEKGEFPFGLYGSEKWRKFVLATFLADLLSYQAPIDQVNFDRLLFVMHAFPQGFRIWWIQLPSGAWWPVGYTGWYPMLENVFDVFDKNPERLKNRMVVPNPSSVGQKPYLYLFNYSAAPSMKKSALTKELMKKYVQDIEAQNASGIACITVSEDGVGVAKRFGMKLTGYLNLDGVQEGIYTLRNLHKNQIIG